VTGYLPKPWVKEGAANPTLVSQLDMQPRPWLDAVNVVTALAATPGVSAYADMGLGQAATGNPEFVSIRGMDTSYMDIP
jgi:outer membrane receptor for ferrienterochelin and colicin